MTIAYPCTYPHAFRRLLWRMRGLVLLPVYVVLSVIRRGQ